MPTVDGKFLGSPSSFMMLVLVSFCLVPVLACAGLNDPKPADLAVLRSEALAYEHGEGVSKDPFRAASLYCDGARFGDAEAQFSLGWIYANGRGLPRSDEMAAYFFKLAAAQGHVQAQKMLRFVGDTAAPMPECMRNPMADNDFDDVSWSNNPVKQKVAGLVRKLAPEYGLSPRLVMAVIQAESNFEPSAVSPKNAQGLMQLIPETAVRFHVRNPLDPEQNIRGGLSYLRWLLAYFEGDVVLVAAAYNAGEGAVDRYRGIPPYAETRRYVKRILSVFRKDGHPYDPGVTASSPELPRIRIARGI